MEEITRITRMIHDILASLGSDLEGASNLKLSTIGQGTNVKLNIRQIRRPWKKIMRELAI